MFAHESLRVSAGFIGVHRGVALVALERPHGGLVAVADVGSHCGDDAVHNDAPFDHKAPIAGSSYKLLASDRGQQLSGLARRFAELAALQRGERRGGA